MTLISLSRQIFDDEHHVFRETVRRFAQREVVPNLERWAEEGRVDRSLYRKAAELGLLGLGADERYDGSGVKDLRFNAVVIEELCAVGASAVGMNFMGFNDLVLPYFTAVGTVDQNEKWLAPMCRGEKIGAIAMTEPGTGSDLAAVAMTAVPDGDGFRLNGAKTFISNGMQADIVIVVAKTDPSAGGRGISLLVVEDGTPGFSKHGPLQKVGLHAQDTAELFFDDVHIPAGNLLGDLNNGFAYLRRNLAHERISIAIASMASATRALDLGLSYSQDRHAFGQPIADFQANRFYLAELATEVQIAQVFVDRCIVDASDGHLDDVHAAMAKWWITELSRTETRPSSMSSEMMRRSVSSS